MTVNTQGLDEILNHIGVGWCGNPFCDKPTFSIEEAKQAILEWVNDEVVAAGDPLSTMADAQVYRELIRAKQRNILKQHGWKESK